MISFGYAYSDNDRSAEQREFRFLATNSALPIAIQRERVDFLLSDLNIQPNRLVLRETTGADGAAAYRASLGVHGVYVQADAEIIPLVRVAGGRALRDRQIGRGPCRSVRGHAARLAGRPEQVLLAARCVRDLELLRGHAAAPRAHRRPLRGRNSASSRRSPTTIRIRTVSISAIRTWSTPSSSTVDARYEWYFGPNQFVAVGGFYKNIDKPVELIVNEVGATQQTTFLNAPKARLYGAEIEVRKFWEPFGGDGWLGRFVWFTAANYTYSKSEVKVEDGDVVFPLANGGLPCAGRHLRPGRRPAAGPIGTPGEFPGRLRRRDDGPAGDGPRQLRERPHLDARPSGISRSAGRSRCDAGLHLAQDVDQRQRQRDGARVRGAQSLWTRTTTNSRGSAEEQSS